jgi:hypothetical protein
MSSQLLAPGALRIGLSELRRLRELRLSQGRHVCHASFLQELLQAAAGGTHHGAGATAGAGPSGGSAAAGLQQLRRLSLQVPKSRQVADALKLRLQEASKAGAWRGLRRLVLSTHKQGGQAGGWADEADEALDETAAVQLRWELSAALPGCEVLVMML